MGRCDWPSFENCDRGLGKPIAHPNPHSELRSPCGSLFSKHFSQGIKNHSLLILTNLTKLFDQSSLIYCSDSIQNNLPVLALKLTNNASRVRSPFRSHWVRLKHPSLIRPRTADPIQGVQFLWSQGPTHRTRILLSLLRIFCSWNRNHSLLVHQPVK